MILVVCAVIKNTDGRYLLVQRSAEMTHPLKWEFPGGKIQPGETPEKAVIREINEELSLQVVPASTLETVIWDYPEKKIGLVPIICELRSKDLKLTEHTAFLWLRVEEMPSVDLLEADLAIVKQLKENP